MRSAGDETVRHQWPAQRQEGGREMEEATRGNYPGAMERSTRESNRPAVFGEFSFGYRSGTARL